LQFLGGHLMLTEEQKKKSSDHVLIPKNTPSYPFGITLAVVLLLGILLIAAIYFHIITP
jgi:hypothetical protein